MKTLYVRGDRKLKGKFFADSIGTKEKHPTISCYHIILPNTNNKINCLVTERILGVGNISRLIRSLL